MVKAGEGYRIQVTGLTHDEHGYPAMNWQAQKKLVGRLVGKIRNNADRIARWEENGLEDADVVVVAYGITSRVAERAVQMARAEGLAGWACCGPWWCGPSRKSASASWRRGFTPSWW